jgi:hypothetical protein
MFCGCTSLTDAPELPAKTLVKDCYKDMFNMNSYENKLSSITVGFSDWMDDTGNIDDYPTYQWVNYNLSSENFVFTCPSDLPEIHDIHHMPTNCRVVRK